MPYPSSPDNVGLRFLCNVHEFSGPCLLALCPGPAAPGPRHTKSLVLPEHHRFELAGRRLCDEENHYFLWNLSSGPVSTCQWLSCDRTREEPISADACGEILGDIPHRSSNVGRRRVCWRGISRPVSQIRLDSRLTASNGACHLVLASRARIEAHPDTGGLKFETADIAHHALCSTSPGRTTREG